MKPFNPISLLLLAAVAAGEAHAQQAASATFASAALSAAPGATVEFGAPKPARDPCGPTASSACEPTRARKTTATLKPAPVPKTDPLAVHPDAAIKETKAPEIDLPGVMKIAGANGHALDFSRARVVDVTNGGSQTVYVSNVDQNRIQLPWANPKVVGTEELTVNRRPDSNNVYVQFKEGVQRAVTVYFEQPDGPSVLGLQLVPKQIPAQTVLVRDSSLLSGEPKPVKGGDYVALTQQLMEQVALGGAPQGYSQVDIAAGPIAMNGLVVTPQKQYSSADKDIYVYDVANPGPHKASLQEKEFDGDTVLAISIFPKPVLAANEHTKVIVLTRKASGG
jgi:conjugal transfer pilus assembly protein TraK